MKNKPFPKKQWNKVIDYSPPKNKAGKKAYKNGYYGV